MDSYYSSPSSYYYHPQPTCPVHDSSSSFLSDSYVDPYSSYPPSYYYPTYNDPTTSSPIVFYNNSTTNIYSPPPSYQVPAQPARNVPVNQPLPSSLNSTFESGRIIFTLKLLICSFFYLAPPTGRRRRQRTIFSKDQVDLLDQVFEKNQYPDIQLREQLSERLDVPEARIQVCSIDFIFRKTFSLVVFRSGSKIVVVVLEQQQNRNINNRRIHFTF
jgi:hypothetical protein